jgi:hypothetical protein
MSSARFFHSYYSKCLASPANGRNDVENTSMRRLPKRFRLSVGSSPDVQRTDHGLTLQIGSNVACGEVKCRSTVDQNPYQSQPKELGVHFWLDGQSRITGFGRYILTSEGRDFDD